MEDLFAGLQEVATSCAGLLLEGFAAKLTPWHSEEQDCLPHPQLRILLLPPEDAPCQLQAEFSPEESKENAAASL